MRNIDSLDSFIEGTYRVVPLKLENSTSSDKPENMNVKDLFSLKKAIFTGEVIVNLLMNLVRLTWWSLLCSAQGLAKFDLHIIDETIEDSVINVARLQAKLGLTSIGDHLQVDQKHDKVRRDQKGFPWTMSVFG